MKCSLLGWEGLTVAQGGTGAGIPLRLERGRLTVKRSGLLPMLKGEGVYRNFGAAS